jgi:hypothetical protein
MLRRRRWLLLLRLLLVVVVVVVETLWNGTRSLGSSAGLLGENVLAAE